jgi:thioredoxin reductase (NADPH)
MIFRTNAALALIALSIAISFAGLYKDMSAYLARRIEQIPNIEVPLNTEVRRMHGDIHLRSVELVDKKTSEARTLQTPTLFSFIGAAPRTDWLPPEIEKDAKGFIRSARRAG